jgi:hypothetical protein
VVQIWPGRFVNKTSLSSSRSYLNHLVHTCVLRNILPADGLQKMPKHAAVIVMLDGTKQEYFLQGRLYINYFSSQPQSVEQDVRWIKNSKIVCKEMDRGVIRGDVPEFAEELNKITGTLTSVYEVHTTLKERVHWRCWHLNLMTRGTSSQSQLKICSTLWMAGSQFKTVVAVNMATLLPLKLQPTTNG